MTTFIKNIFSKIPNDWNIEKFEKYIYFQEGPGLRKWQFAEKGIPFLNIRCIKDNGTIDKSKVQFLNEQEKEKYSHFMLEENDTILSSSGSVGKMAIIKKEDLPLMLNTSIIRLKSKNKNKVFDNYMRYFVKSKLFSKQYMQESQGSAQVNFGPTHLKKMYISLPPLEEQKKIAEILSTVDQKIAFVDNRIEETELLKKGLMQKLLTEGIGHSEFKDSEVGRIPESWEVLKIEKIISSEKNSIKVGPFGSQIKKEDLLENGLYRIYGQENVIRNDFSIGKRFLSEEKYQSLKSNTIQENDIIITTMGTGEQCKVVPKNIEVGIMDSHLIRIRCNLNKAFPKFIAKLIHESYVIKKQIKRLSQGAIMSGLSAKIIKSLVFPIPSVHEQKQIVEILSITDEKIENLKAKKESFKELKKGLMQKLLTGEVRV